jgi:hypothetical protein
VLHLPDVAELVRDEVLVREEAVVPQQNRPPRRVAVETMKPGEPEEPRHDEDADMLDSDRFRIQVEAVEPSLGPLERGAAGLVSAQAWSDRRKSATVPSWICRYSNP